MLSFDESAQVIRVERFWSGGTNSGACSVAVTIESIAPGDGGLVDPVPGHGPGRHIGGGLVVFDNDLSVVAVASPGHRGVDAAAVGERLEEEERCRRCGALGGVAGLDSPNYRVNASR